MASNAHMIALQVCIQARVPVFLWGIPGIGKTIVTEKIAEGLDENIWTVILSLREPTDQGGLPVIDGDGVKMVPPLWARELSTAGHGIVFWDEFNTALPPTQSSALRTIHGNYAGDLRLPDETSHVAAGNPPDKSTGGFHLTSAIANRWTHLDWKLSAGEFADGMIGGWPDVPIFPLPAGWRSRLQAKRGLVGAFVKVRSTYLDMLPADRASQGQAWPSPRMWDRASLLLAAADAIHMGTKSEVASLLLRGCVGAAAAAEFSSWVVNLDLRDPEEYLNDPENTPLPPRQDQILATLDSVASAALDTSQVSRREMLPRYYSAWRLIGRLIDADKGDLTLPAARTLTINMPPEADDSDKLPKELEAILPMLEKAGIEFGAPHAT